MFWAFGGGGRRAAPEAPPPFTPSPRPQRRSAEEGEEEAPVAAASLFESDAFFRLGRVLSQQQQPSTPPEMGQVRGSGVGWWDLNKNRVAAVVLGAGRTKTKQPAGICPGLT